MLPNGVSTSDEATAEELKGGAKTSFEALGTRRKIVNLHVAFIKADLPPSFLFLL